MRSRFLRSRRSRTWRLRRYRDLQPQAQAWLGGEARGEVQGPQGLLGEAVVAAAVGEGEGEPKEPIYCHYDTSKACFVCAYLCLLCFCLDQLNVCSYILSQCIVPRIIKVSAHQGTAHYDPAH